MYGKEEVSIHTYQSHRHVHPITKAIETSYRRTYRDLCNISVPSSNADAHIEDYLQAGMLCQVILIELL